MAETEEQKKAELQESLNKLVSITPESLVRTNELGTSLDFKQGVDVFERTLKLFRDLKEANLDNVPTNILNNLKNQVEQASASFEQIKQFGPADNPNPAQVRDSLIQQVQEQYPSQFKAISPIIAYSVRKGTDFEALEQQARETLDQLNKIRTDLEEAGKSIVSEAEASLEQVRKAAAEAGVSQHSIHFKNEATDHKNKGFRWLIATAVIALITVGYGGWNVYYYMTHDVQYGMGQAIQIGIAKILIFSVLYFAVVWCGRVYRSEIHNYVINQHRQNALSTFETFVKAASDPQTKDAVLIQATQSIFAPQVSAFTTQETDSSYSPKILEIIRSAVSSSPSAS